ncbi:hypothetical protein AVEN_166565-1 [Araneus ventricosus]|uniref:Uncharacterized protein n=1 Tax=Araneus ventricosus TaxID=182803 RepID=A0A4Y2L138_ARAVE|nr:hypothetical protein AVEN_166565-1 [Araneus ventricosus]
MIRVHSFFSQYSPYRRVMNTDGLGRCPRARFKAFADLPQTWLGHTPCMPIISLAILKRIFFAEMVHTYIRNPRRTTHPKGLESARIDGEELLRWWCNH